MHYIYILVYLVLLLCTSDAFLGQKGAVGKSSLTQLLASPFAMRDRLASILFQRETTESRQSTEEVLNAIVRVHCTHSPPDHTMPWQRLRQEYSTSSAFAINGRRILTNAHAVEYGSLVQIKKRASEEKFLARVKAVGHECDLALLEVEDDGFWEDITPLRLGSLPELQDDVTVIGYPVGGDSISISSGVVSRVEMTEYAQASADLLAIQIDAAINPGNSGGPVFNSKLEVIGVAFQGLSDEETENIGYVVPPQVINHFLEDVERNGYYSGVCGIGAHLQGMESKALRNYYGMNKNHTGVLVLKLSPLAPSSKLLKQGDVIMSVDGIPVANDGSLPFRHGTFRERVGIGHHFSLKFPSDIVTMDVLRDRKCITVDVPLHVPTKIVPRMLGRSPSYLMIGGFVFVSLSMEYVEAEYKHSLEYMKDIARYAADFRIMAETDQPRRLKDEERVILTQVLAHPVNIGYQTMRNVVLSKLNDTQITSLAQLKLLIFDTVTNKIGHHVPDIVLEFENGQVVVVNGTEAMAASDQLCDAHGLPRPFSKDLN
jgi:S1-C subfamily serine protease